MNGYKITAERIEGFGGWSISTVIGSSSYGYRLHRSYYNYTKREALVLFRQYIQEVTQ
jgi:hypothetical protein